MSNIPIASGFLDGYAVGNSDLVVAHSETRMVLSYRGIEISGDFNWTNAALGLLEIVLKWQKEPRTAIYYDWRFTGTGKVKIGKILIDAEHLELTSTYDTNSGGQAMFDALKEQFDKAKKMKAFL